MHNAKEPKTTPCYHCGKETPSGQRRCVHCGKEVGTAADFAVILFLVFGVPLGLALVLAAEGVVKVLGGMVLAFSVAVSLWGGGAIWRGERKVRKGIQTGNEGADEHTRRT